MKRFFKKLVRILAAVLAVSGVFFLFADYYVFWYVGDLGSPVRPIEQTEPNGVIGRTWIKFEEVYAPLYIKHDYRKNALRWRFEKLSYLDVFVLEKSVESILKILEEYNDLRQATIDFDIELIRSLGSIEVLLRENELARIRFEFWADKTGNLVFRRLRTGLTMHLGFELYNKIATRREDTDSHLHSFILPHEGAVQLQRVLDDLWPKEFRKTAINIDRDEKEPSSIHSEIRAEQLPTKDPYKQFLHGEIDVETLDSLVRERRSSESPATALGPSRDLSASIEESPAPKNPYQQFLHGEIDVKTLNSLLRERRSTGSPATAVESAKDMATSIDELYRAWVRDEISDSELHKALRLQDRARESTATGVESAKDVSTLIEEIIAIEKDPGRVFFVLGGALKLGNVGIIDRPAARQFLKASLKYQHAGAASFLGALAEEDGERRRKEHVGKQKERDLAWEMDKGMSAGYYRLAEWLYEDHPRRYGNSVERCLKEIRENAERVEKTLDPFGQWCALSWLKIQMEELWGM